MNGLCVAHCCPPHKGTILNLQLYSSWTDLGHTHKYVYTKIRGHTVGRLKSCILQYLVYDNKLTLCVCVCLSVTCEISWMQCCNVMLLHWHKELCMVGCCSKCFFIWYDAWLESKCLLNFFRVIHETRLSMLHQYNTSGIGCLSLGGYQCLRS